jgi:hypothetical protein
MKMDELELVPANSEPYFVRAGRIAEELRELADTIEDNPEMAKLRDPVEVAEHMRDDLAALDALADLGRLDVL